MEKTLLNEWNKTVYSRTEEELSNRERDRQTDKDREQYNGRRKDRYWLTSCWTNLMIIIRDWVASIRSSACRSYCVFVAAHNFRHDRSWRHTTPTTRARDPATYLSISPYTVIELSFSVICHCCTALSIVGAVVRLDSVSVRAVNLGIIGSINNNNCTFRSISHIEIRIDTEQ